MEQSQGSHSDVARAEVLMERAGESIGVFAASTWMRIQKMTSSMRTEADTMDQPKAEAVHEEEQREAQNGASSQAIQGHPTTRAEVLLDQAGGRLGMFVAIATLEARRISARMREDLEDIWVEAQSIRRK